MAKHISKSEKEWKSILTDAEYKVLREKDTEPPFAGKYVYNTEKGVYVCAGCGNELFSSDFKFDSACGWPSFSKPFSNENIEFKPDDTFGMNRIEVLCKRCGGHLGHVFDDGPLPSGKRFCINSVALHLKKK